MSLHADLTADVSVETLLAQCLEQNDGERLQTLERVCSTHPEHATELRHRWQALARMGLVDPEPEAGVPQFPERLGDFRLLERLGGGGMGIVYLARQESLGREVALKLIRPEQLFFPGVRARFQREATAIARLSHPGIVPIHVVGEQDGVPFFAMERIVGCTLADALDELHARAPESLHGRDLHAAVCKLARTSGDIADGSPFALDWVACCLAIARQVAEALEHAHARGCLHRDVKPSNLMLTPDGRALLVDFGLTALSDSRGHTRTGAMIGTLSYMAPEQVRANGAIDARTDVYGLGATLYELLTLQLPYRGDDDLQTQIAILDARPDSIRARNRDVDADVETVCLVAMDPDPARRYANAGALAHDLFQATNGEPIRARPPGPWRKAMRWISRHRAVAALGATLLAAVVSIPTIVAIQQNRHAWDMIHATRAKAEQLHYLLDSFRAATASSPDAPLSLNEAMAAAEQGLERQFADRPWLAADLRVSLGWTDLQLREYARAAQSLDSAVTYFEAHPQTPREYLHPDEAKAYLAEALTLIGDYARAEELLDEVLPKYEARADDPYSKARYCRAVQAEVWWHTGRAEAAKELLRANLDQPSNGDGDVARALGNLANAVFHLEDYEEAVVLGEAALDHLRTLERPDEEDFITILSNTGVALKMQKKLDQAEPYYDEAVERADRLWDAPSELVGGLKLNRAGLMEAREQFDAALEGYLRAGEMLEKAAGARSRGVAIARGNAAALLTRMGRCDEAEAMYEDVLPLQRSVFVGHEAAIPGFSLRNLARCARARGDDERAATLLREAIQHFESIGRGDLARKAEEDLAALEGKREVSANR